MNSRKLSKPITYIKRENDKKRKTWTGSHGNTKLRGCGCGGKRLK